MHHLKKILIIIFLISIKLSAQNLQIKIIDSNTNQPLPSASISINSKTNIIANEEGFFNLTESQNQDENILAISYLGYVTSKISIKEIKQQNLIIKLEEAIYELDDVTVKSIKLNPDQIMQEVKKRLATNYKTERENSKSLIFSREYSEFKPEKFNFEIDKSTGFTKKQLEVVDQEIRNYINKISNKSFKNYRDILAEYYTSYKIEKTNKTQHQKINVLKATNIKGDESTSSTDDVMNKFSKLVMKHLDSTKYYRVKSGWFGSRDTISFKKDKKSKKEISNTSQTKNFLQDFFVNQNLSNDKFDFINQPELYQYTLKGKTYDDENNDIIYILNFTPRKSRAKYTGTLYVSENDYAVIKCNYKLEEGEILEGLNLKLLLGIKFRVNINNGTLLFKKDSETKNYELQYASEDKGLYFYLNRPVKFIEITKGEKDVFSFDIKVEGNSHTKEEVLLISKTENSQNEFNKLTEKDFEYVNIKKYDPSIWKNYISIEPVNAMKQYKAID
jgi:hypothetical protein